MDDDHGWLEEVEAFINSDGKLDEDFDDAEDRIAAVIGKLCADLENSGGRHRHPTAPPTCIPNSFHGGADIIFSTDASTQTVEQDFYDPFHKCVIEEIIEEQCSDDEKEKEQEQEQEQVEYQAEEQTQVHEAEDGREDEHEQQEAFQPQTRTENADESEDESTHQEDEQHQDEQHQDEQHQDEQQQDEQCSDDESGDDMQHLQQEDDVQTKVKSKIFSRRKPHMADLDDSKIWSSSAMRGQKYLI